MIFVVEDNAPLCEATVQYLAHTGLLVRGFGAAEAALEAARRELPDVLVTDLELPCGGGLDLVGEVKALSREVMCILVTGHGSKEVAAAAVRAGCYEYLEKPVDLERLHRTIRRARAERNTARVQARSWDRDRPILEDVLQAYRVQIESLRSVPPGERPPILLTGETGTGKGVLARWLHAYCVGEERPMVDVNCAAIPDTLFESELFGHERSAFTDAKDAKAGLFEAADGGTLFLDEVGEISLASQAKLLRVVESGRVQRLGALNERPISETLIAASNRDLDAAWRAGLFRKDLYFRLAAFHIAIAPLRERRAIIPDLARLFLRRATTRYRRSATDFSAAALDRLASSAWPGNIRELEFTIERAVMACPVDAPSVTHVDVGGEAPHARQSGSAIHVEIPDAGMSLRGLEQAALEAALVKAQGNVSEAARLLQISRDKFRYRLRHG
jgi:DNA-binding NtrC family response regulator